MLLNIISVYKPDFFFLVQALVSTLFAILFLQSGIDKVKDRKGNLEWLTGHFANSPLANMVPLLLSVITMVEILAGAVSAIAVGEAIIVGESIVYETFGFAFVGTTLSAIALLMLFFGQRMAKDYAGAGGLVPYFILAILNLYFLA